MDEILTLLANLVASESTTSDMEKVNHATNIMKAFLDNHNIHTILEQVNGRNVLYASNCPNETPDLLLNSHLDTVPAEQEQYHVKIHDGKIYGRGTADCLGNAVCIAKILLSAPKGTKIGAVFSTDEETGGSTTGYMADKGYTANYCILVLDNSEQSIIYAQKGVLVVELTARGLAGHAAYPWLCDNPIDKLMLGYTNFLKTWINPKEDADWKNSLSACMISAGNANNQIPGTASMTLNFRFTHDDDKDEILKMLSEKTGCETRIVELVPPVSFDSNLPQFQVLAEAMNHASHGRKTYPLERLCGATDSRHWKKTGIPVAVAGILGGNIHAQDEYAELESFDTLVQAVLQVAVHAAEIRKN